ncbi:MAG: CRTAC1 family protein [Acidobacteriota bacterium]
MKRSRFDESKAGLLQTRSGKRWAGLHTIFLFVFVATFVSLTTAQSPAISFTDISAASGINVSHVSTPENRYIIESMSGGAAVFDCDGDGFLDVATVNGSSVERFKKGGDPMVTLYRQIDGEKSKTPKFDNITQPAGLTRKGWGMAVTAIDHDNDGILDLFVTGFNGNALYRGTGQCKFQDVTEKSGLAGSGFMTGAAWADYDRDGDLDLFVVRYVSIDLVNLPVFGSSPTCSFQGIRVQCGPRGLPGESDLFFRNKGDGTFEEISKKIGVSDDKKYYGLGVIWCDYNDDGWPDVYVANDGTPNYLYKNNKDGTFTDVSFESGTSYSGAGVEQGSMGVTWGDYDGDGKLDLFVTNFDNEHNTLYRNLGSKGFLDVSMESKVGPVSVPYTGWGTAFSDLDNDGWPDLFVVNGHVYPQIELAQSRTQLGFRQQMLLDRNLGNGTFEEISDAAGLRKLPLQSRRGAAFGDLNNDGMVDIVITNLGEPPTVLLNTTRNANNCVTFKLIGSGGNHDAIGARLTLKTAKRLMTQEVEAGASYLSQNDLRLHFGLGPEDKIVSAEVRWSDGKTETISNVPLNQIVTITEAKGVTSSQNFRNR